jgi:ABC-type proline/glycine betaine transport system ATPase subunit
MTVGENLRYPLRRHRWSRRDADRRVKEVLELIRLSGMEARRPHELSGGQQQRVALGRALAFNPSLLLMDEPLGALDRALRVEMQEELRRIQREVGATFVFVTHDREEALAMSTRIGVMRDAELIQVGTPEELYERPSDSFVGRFAEPARDTAVVLLHPSRLRMLPRPGDVSLNSRVVDVQYLGELVRVTTEVPGMGRLLLTPARAESAAVQEGRSLTLWLSEADLICVPDSMAGVDERQTSESRPKR